MTELKPKGQKPQKNDVRRKRQAEALRANLRRRKAPPASPGTTDEEPEDTASGRHSPNT